MNKNRGKYKNYYEGEFVLPKSTKFDKRKRNSNSDSSSSDSDDIQKYREYAEASINENNITPCPVENKSLGEKNTPNSHEVDSVRHPKEVMENSSEEPYNLQDIEMPCEERILSNDDCAICDIDADNYYAPSECPINDEEDYSVSSDFEYDSDDDMDYHIDHTIQEGDKIFLNLDEFLNNEDSNRISDAKINVSECEMLLGILKFSMQYSLTQDGIESLCLLINTFFDKKVVPDTKYCINKLLSATDGVKYHAYCNECNIYIKKFDRSTNFVRCQVCNKNLSVKGSNDNYFVTLNVRDEIRNLLENSEEFYDFIINERESVPGEQQDICDGLLYQEFRESLSAENRNSYVTCIFNSDGSPIFKSTTFAIWPIQIILNELPVNVRNNKPITCALWFGKNKPNMNIFLNAFVDDMNQLSSQGIRCVINNEIKNIKLYPICSCVDSVARAPMQGSTQFNGYFGCNWCLYPGILVKQKKRKVIKYPLLDYIPKNREVPATLVHLQHACETGQSVYGMKNVTPLLKLDKFNIIRGFVVDPMHCVLLGICKQFGNYWFSKSKEIFSIHPTNIKKINKLLLSFKTPSQIARYTRSIEDKKHWKAKEWENWLLYYSIPLLSIIPNFDIYVKHWALLVDAIHILMSSTVNTMKLIHAEQMLKEFVAKTELIYSQRAMTFNIHQLLHLSQSVIDWGPLWAHTGFGFENGNGKILRNVKAARGVLHQICKRIDYNQSAEIMQKHVTLRGESPIVDFCCYLEYKNTKNNTKLSNCRYFGRPTITKRLYIEAYELNMDFTNSYFRMVKENCIFSSSKRNSLRTCNCYAQTSDGQFVEITEFIVDSENMKELTICKNVITEDLLYCNTIKKIRIISNDTIVIQTAEISNIAILTKVDKVFYITATPNMYYF